MEISTERKQENGHPSSSTTRTQAAENDVRPPRHEQHGQDEEQNHHKKHELTFRNRFFISLILATPLLLLSPTIRKWLGYELPSFAGNDWIMLILAVVLYIVGALPFLRMAYGELKEGQPGMMMLISLAISVAFIYSLTGVFFGLGRSFFWELATLIVVMLLGHWLEMRSVRKASSSLDELAKLMPDQAHRIREDDETEEVAVSELRVDDLLLIRPGASIPADGRVVEGRSEVNESIITGESKPVEKTEGDDVIAGTTNDSGSLRVKVTAVGEDTALSGIMQLVEEAQKSKSETQMLADRAAGWLFYAALAAALLTTVVWSLATGFDSEVLKRSVTVLVIACPHALGLAVPLVVAITTTAAANNGILVRDRVALEKARDVNTIVFDKTGTLTKGQQGLQAHKTTSEYDDAEALALAAATEGDSEHLIAEALRQAADEKELDLPDVKEFRALKGRGVQASYQGEAVYVGSKRLLEEQGIELSANLAAFADDAANKGQTVVFLIMAGELMAAFALSDVIREESHTAAHQLREKGFEVALLTGDSRDVAETVASELEIEQVFAEVLPDQKDQKIQDLQESGARVMMVGDGVNDAPALARADVGVAIGGGTDVAVESAGLILVQDNPLDVVKMLELSDASHSKMVQNLWWAAGYNIIAIPLAAGVLAPIGFVLPPAIGALIMSVSTIIVAINAQFLRGWSYSNEEAAG